MNVVACENLTRRFGKTLAVDQLNLQIPEGAIFALLGENGAGKTTTLKLLLNLIQPSSGHVRIFGEDMARASKQIFQRIGYVSEETRQPDWMNLPEFLRYCRSFYDHWDRDLEATLRKAFRLPEDRPLKAMSRGMRMKATLMSSICFRPPLLIMDEPFSGLDPKMRDDLTGGLLEMIGGEKPCTIILSSHDIFEVERLADHVGILTDGRLNLAEPLASLQERIRHIQVVHPFLQQKLKAPYPPAWEGVETPSPTLLHFTHKNFTPEVETEVRNRFPGATVEVTTYSLRELFLISTGSSTPSAVASSS